jgi:hypothetical protein
MSSLKSIFLGILLCVLLSANALQAELTWEHPEVQYKASVEDKAYEAVFPFVNDGSRTVLIDWIKSSCGCTTPVLKKKKYLPGESDEIRALFTFGDRIGLQSKLVTIRYRYEDGLGFGASSDPKEFPIQREELTPPSAEFRDVELKLSVEIPVKFNISARLLSWNRLDEPSAQEITLEVHPDLSYAIESIEANNDLFTTAFESVGEHKFFIRVTPRSTNEKGRSILRVRLKNVEGQTKDFNILATVYE